MTRLRAKRLGSCAKESGRTGGASLASVWNSSLCVDWACLPAHPATLAQRAVVVPWRARQFH